MSYRRQGPNPVLVVLMAAMIVFGGYYLWEGSRNWFEQDTINKGFQTETAEYFATENSIAQATRDFKPYPTSTRVPDCEFYIVEVSSAWVRMCPALTCESVGRYYEGNQVCVMGRATDNEYFDADDWFVIDLNEGQLFADIAYMHESVLQPANPTPRPSMTFTPLPTITLTPSPEFPTTTPLPEGSPTTTPEGRVEF